MSYKAYLNDTELIFDSSFQEDTITMIDPVVLIEAGSAGYFDFILPPTHKSYGQLKRTTDYIDVYRDDETDPRFSGRVYQIVDLMDGREKIKCEGALTMLSDTVFRPVTFQGKLHTLVSNIITSHNSQVEAKKQISIGTVTVANSDVYREYLNYETSISRMKDLVDSFGGYLMIRKTNGSWYLDWLEDFTTPCTQKIELTSNILDISKTIDSADLATVILPLGAKDGNGNRLTIKSVNNDLDYITADQEYISEYGYIVKVVIWDDVTIASNLKSKAETRLQAALTPKTEIDLAAVDLADAGYDVDSFKVGQKIAVTSAPYGLNAVQFSCVKQKLQLLNPGQNRLELGEIKVGYIQSQRNNSEEQTLISITKQIEHSQDVMQLAISAATQLITGNSGGYVVLHDSNEDTYPDEMLIMDTDDIETTVKVWRWNNSGLGYSSAGYDGPYGTAITMNGGIVADFLTVGTIRGGNSYWNLETGEIVIAGYATTESLSAAEELAQAAQNTANSKITTFCQNSEPSTGMNKGDLWMDTSDGNKIYRYSGSAWVSVQDTAIQTALTAAADAQSTADGKIVTFASTTIPTATDVGDLWIDTDDNNKMYRWDGTDWVSVRDGTISTANSLAQNALNVANGKITTFYQASEPDSNSGRSEGDLWIDTGDGNSLHRFNGSAWVNVVDLAIHTALTNAADAQSTADSKIVTFAQTSPPTATDVGDLWVDTDDNNKLYRWDGSSWVSIRDTLIATAQSTANGALASVVSLYYRSTSSSTPSISTSSSIGTSDNTSNAWEYVIPKPKNGCYFFTCEKYTDKAGNVSFSTVRQMSNLTASSLWCSANDASYIDGSNIHASTITANKLNISDLQAIGATIGAFHIDTNSIYSGTKDTGTGSNDITLRGSGTFTRTIGGTSRGALKFAIGSTFGVDCDGWLYADHLVSNNATITGGKINISTSSAYDDIIKLSYVPASGSTKTIAMEPMNIQLISSATSNSTYTRNYLDSSGITLSYGSTSYDTIRISGVYEPYISLRFSGSRNGIFMSAESTGGVLYLKNSGETNKITLRGSDGWIICTGCSEQSDRRLKNNIKALDKQKSSEFVYALSPLSFTYRDRNPGEHHGFVAQDIEDIRQKIYGNDRWNLVYTPEITRENPEAYKSLAYTELIADIVATLQTHNDRLIALETA